MTVYALTASNLAAGVPVLGQPAAVRNIHLRATSLAAGSPELGMPKLIARPAFIIQKQLIDGIGMSVMSDVVEIAGGYACQFHFYDSKTKLFYALHLLGSTAASVTPTPPPQHPEL